MRSKTKTNRTFNSRFSHTGSKFQAIATKSDWFIALFAPAVISCRNYFGIGYATVISGKLFWDGIFGVVSDLKVRKVK